MPEDWHEPSYVPLVAIIRHENPEGCRRARELGAVATVGLDLTAGDLVDAVEAAHRQSSRGGARGRLGLTERETQVLTLICRGLSNAEIAKALFLSQNSVKTYIRTAYRKIGVTRRSQAVLWAIRHGL